MESETNTIIDSENWKSGGEGYGYRDITLQQIRRITIIGSQELTKGFWKKSWHQQAGQVLSSYVPDGRQAYSNSIEILHDILLPKFDDEMKKHSIELNKEVEELYSECKQNDNNEKWCSDKVKIMRRMFQQLCLFLQRINWLEESAVSDE